MRHRPLSLRLFILLVTLPTMALTTAAWSQDPPKKKKNESKAVTKALKKVDRQILSYSPAKARELLEPVMEEKDPRVDAATGQILVLEKDYEGAAAKLNAASRKSDDPLILIALGDAQAYAKKKGQANTAYTQAAGTAEALLGADSTDSNARLALGVAQQRLKQYDQAVANLTQARSEDPGNPRIPFELGMTRLLQGDNQAAFDHLSGAIEIYSGYAYAYYYRALAANKIDRKDIAVNDLDRFLALAPDAPEAPRASRLLESFRG